MRDSNLPCAFDVDPSAALAAIRDYNGPVIVDLDETLYLRNSTEDFIDSARPRLLALLVLRALDIMKPWRLSGEATCDTWRICLIWIMFPWTMWYWRKKAQGLAQEFANGELQAALKGRLRPPIILTSGFEPIVRPLVAAMGFSAVPLVAARMYSLADRRNGKLQMATRKLGAEVVRCSLVVTDSISDLELLQRCSRPLRTRWPGALYRRALSGVYLPGEYISKIKRPGERQLRGILLDDFAGWSLSSIGLASYYTTHIAGLLLLLLSFWSIYEMGYVDNDAVASRRERDPKLSTAFGHVQVATPAVQPWVWALISGAAGVWVLHPEPNFFALNFGLWVLVLMLMYGCFLLYNRLDKTSRVWVYPQLQFSRFAAFMVIVPIEPVGIAALGAHVLSRWAPYIAYRHGAGSWPETRMNLVRLIAFAFLSLMIVSAFGLTVLLTWTALALLLWNLFRARRDICAVLTSARILAPQPRVGGNAN